MSFYENNKCLSAFYYKCNLIRHQMMHLSLVSGFLVNNSIILCVCVCVCVLMWTISQL